MVVCWSQVESENWWYRGQTAGRSGRRQMVILRVGVKGRSGGTGVQRISTHAIERKIGERISNAGQYMVLGWLDQSLPKVACEKDACAGRRLYSCRACLLIGHSGCACRSSDAHLPFA